MNRSLVPLVAIALAGCGSSSSDGLRSAPPLQRSIMTVETGDLGRIVLEVPTGGEVSTGSVAAAADELWPVLAEIYGALGLEVNAVDTPSRTLGVQQQRVRRIGGKRPAGYLDCGSGLNGSFANAYDVTLTVLTQLRPVGEGSTDVRTLVEASAKDPAHGNNAVRCASTHALERQIVEALRARAAAAAEGRVRQPGR